MKTTIKYCLIIFTAGILFFGCEKSAPTLLIEDNTEDPLEVELIPKETDDDLYSNGSDSTGIADPRNFTNIIAVSGVKTTRGFVTVNASLAQAVFFDRSGPVYIKRRIIGYRTRTPGAVDFNNVSALRVPYRIKYRLNNETRDTLLGSYYLLYNGVFNFPYEGNINFKFNPVIGENVTFNIPTPPEITGNIRLEGRRANKSLKLHLEWNPAGEPALKEVEIIIGAGLRLNEKQTVSLYRIKTKDDGSLIIPSKLISEIYSERFSRIVITYIRKYENKIGNDTGELNIISQSIHSIIADIP